MNQRTRTFTMLVAGPFADAGQLVEKLAAHDLRARPRGDQPFAPGDIEILLVEHDHFGDAFAFGRGYADIDPERVWEQWQIVRAAQSNG